MESSHLSGEETVPASQVGSSLQVSGEPNFLSQNSDDFLANEKDASRSDDDASLSDEDAMLSDFDEEEDICNIEDSVQTEDVDVVETNNENDKKYKIYLGMEFSSDESAYKAYRKYGANHGFDVRKQRTSRGKDQKLKRMVYVCSKEGFKQELTVKKSYSRPTTRCGCKARISCYLQSNGRYKIMAFESNNNHDLVRTPMKHLLKGNRAISISQKQHADDADMSGISTKATVEMMSREVGGPANLGFTDKDLRNYIYRKRKTSFW